MEALPDNVVRLIFDYVPNRDIVGHVPAVCKRFKSLSVKRLRSAHRYNATSGIHTFLHNGKWTIHGMMKRYINGSTRRYYSARFLFGTVLWARAYDRGIERASLMSKHGILCGISTFNIDGIKITRDLLCDTY